MLDQKDDLLRPLEAMHDEVEAIRRLVGGLGDSTEVRVINSCIKLETLIAESIKHEQNNFMIIREESDYPQQGSIVQGIAKAQFGFGAV